jgi:hypothetical protein
MNTQYTLLQAFAAVRDLCPSEMVTQRALIVTDVSGQPIGPIFKGRALLE